jgi:hypothetical protein
MRVRTPHDFSTPDWANACASIDLNSLHQFNTQIEAFSAEAKATHTA